MAKTAEAMRGGEGGGDGAPPGAGGVPPTLVALRGALCRFAASFEVSNVSAAALGGIVLEAARIESTAATVKAMAAAAMARGDTWKEAGDRSAAHHLARSTGTTLADAKETLADGEALAKVPALDAAARAGQISSRQRSIIAGAATVDPAAAETLLDAARTSSLSELAELAAKMRAAADPDPEATRRRIHRSRSLRTHTDSEGAFQLHLRDTVDRGAEIMAALEPLRDAVFEAARRAGRRESPEAYGADALVELARRSMARAPGPRPSAGTADPSTAADTDADTSAPPGADADDPPSTATEPTATPGAPASAAGPATPIGLVPAPRAPAKIIVRVDYETLMRGRVAGQETCEIAGLGPIAPSVVAELLLSPNTFLAAVVTKAKAVMGVVHFGRQPTAHQRTALEWLYATCSVQGCSARAHLEIDHIVDWAATHRTTLEKLAPLCHHHHKKKTEEGWMLIEGIGSRPFVPPSDPRHPKYRPGPPPPRAGPRRE